MILILVENITNRLEYTFDFIFKERGLDYKFTTRIEEYDQYPANRRLNYSHHDSVNRHLTPSELLFDIDVNHYKIDKAKFQDVECLSINEQKDPVASIFYVLTRYEEYHSTNLDEHKRFQFKYSLLHKFEWIEKAVCDRWAKQIVDIVDPELLLQDSIIRGLMSSQEILSPTFDIDNAFAYKHKSGIRRLGAIVKDIIKWRKHRRQERKRVEKGEHDPYDTFDLIQEINKRFDKSNIFWLVRSKGGNDRNLPLSNAEHQALIKRMAAAGAVNLHPSYKSYQNSSVIQSEKRALEDVIGSVVETSRFHYLRFNLPTSYQSLIEAGIKHDYSMGFAEHFGFRIGTARAYPWFDLSSNQVTELMVHPFVYMDGTFNEYMHLSIQQSKEVIDQLMKEVKMYGGDFCFIWHNETIGDYGKWQGWSEVLNYTINHE